VIVVDEAQAELLGPGADLIELVRYPSVAVERASFVGGNRRDAEVFMPTTCAASAASLSRVRSVRRSMCAAAAERSLRSRSAGQQSQGAGEVLVEELRDGEQLYADTVQALGVHRGYAARGANDTGRRGHLEKVASVQHGTP
jgi:hypothetical protein